MQSYPQRHRAKWSYSEIDKLHREFELETLTVEEIALNHGRTSSAILYKLQSEGLLDKEGEDENDESVYSSEDDEEADDGDDEEDEEDDESVYSSEDDGSADDSSQETTLSSQIGVFSAESTNFVVKCVLTYCKAINRLVDIIFDTSRWILPKSFR